MTLITEEYRKQQQHLHETTEYGVASKEYAPIVTQIIDRLGVTHVLDYGCGARTNLLRNIRPRENCKFQCYDPGVPRFSGAPVPAQLVCCVDVLEHVEPSCLDAVLDDLERLAEAALFCTVHTGPAVKTLPDGRNAHLIQEPMQWWLPKLWDRFDIQTVQVSSEFGFYVIGVSKPHQIIT